MKTRNKLTKTMILSVAIGMIGGCGGAYDASVEGLVTLDGTPVPSGSISFIPSDGGPPAYAHTDPSGRYEVFTGSEEGLPPGQYGVTIVAREKPQEIHSKLGGPNPGKPLTPPWYRSSRSSPLKFAVDPGSNEIDLELSLDPPSNWTPPKRQRR